MPIEPPKSAAGRQMIQQHRSVSQVGSRCQWSPSSRIQTFWWVVLALASISVVQAQLEPNRSPAIEKKGFRHPSLYLANQPTPVNRLGAADSRAAADRLQSLGLASSRGYLDPRSDRWSTLLLAEPLIAGNGKGNTRVRDQEEGARPSDSESLAEEAWRGLKHYLSENRLALGVDIGELQEPPSVVVHDQGERIQIHAQRVVDGIVVRDSFLSAVINHGNLVLLGSQVWGDVEVSTGPTVDLEQARDVLSDHLRPLEIVSDRTQPELILVPTVADTGPTKSSLGQGYRYRLAWVLSPVLAGESGTWQALIDAHNGELLEFQDRNSYASTRTVTGGVFPVSNDGTAPDGVEQAGYPMPFADISSATGSQFSDSGGNHPVCAEGDVTTSLNGKYIKIDDFCGLTSETSSGNLDLGTSSGADCEVPASASSLGNTHAARTGFYELNRIAEQARGQLPGNQWLQNQLTAVVNIPDLGSPEFNCNAFWDEITINFFTSGSVAPGLVCGNTGELAGVLDHEWGHGLDNNDVNRAISSPGEGIADVYASMRLNDSCIARGFYQVQNNCGDDDPCLTCDGVRDIDWRQRTSQSPHDIAWIDNSCQPPLLGDIGPCGGAIHCEGAVYSEAFWDLVHWDLQSSPFNMDLNTALEVGTRLAYLGAGPVGNWYSCVDGTGTGDGCNGDGGYLNLLAVDDDNGDLSDGTPHMEAIFAAFDRHGIACATPTIQNGGCSSSPATPPVVVASPVDRGVDLSWAPVPDASGYEIFRTDGEFACDFGKIKVGETSATSFFDDGLLNGREYSYVVIPKGTDSSCFGPASSCTSVIPVAGASLGLDPGSVDLTFINGDLDAFLDNCETAELGFDVFNTGTGQLTNVRVVGFEPISHPGSLVVTTPVPLNLAPSLDSCDRARGVIAFQADGLSFNETLEIRVDVTSDELGGRIKSHLVRLLGAETSVQPEDVKVFDFESGLDGWEVVAGTFGRFDTGGGAGASSFYMASSSNLPDQCDVVRSPIMRLSDTSTLSLSTQFDIETFVDIEGDIFWFDRANVGIHDLASGQRTMVEPNGGRPYNAGGLYGSCGTQNQPGWADTEPSWSQSTWSVFALDSASHAGDFVQIDVSYGTDAFEEGAGFSFDQVTVTDIDLIVADGQADTCQVANQAPTALDDPITMDSAVPTEIVVLGNDSDPDPGDTLRVIGVTQPAMGQTSINSFGPGLDTVTYVPDGGPGRVDTFEYSVSDGMGGSDIAQVTIDLDLLFYDGFEQGDAGLWDVSAGSCDPDGSWTLDGPPIQFSCCLGLVNIDISQFDFSADGATITSSPTNPVPLVGAATTCPASGFSNSGSLVGGCTETYSLDGSFTGPDSWSGTYSMEFVGPDCATCTLLDPLNPCIEQVLPVSASRP